MSFLEAQQIVKSYGGRQVLNDISFSLNEGELLVIVGQSGSGKSSLLRILAGLLDADGGEVRLEGEVLKGPARMLVPGYEDVQLVHQDLELHPYLKLEELVKQNLSGYTQAYKEERSEALLRLAGLWEERAKLPTEISGGQQQKIAISAALANEPKLLLLDEPFSNLDPFSKQAFLSLIKQEAALMDTTIIMVTHDTRDALLTGDRIIVLNEGELIQDGMPRDIYLRPSNKFVAQFFGPVNILNADVLRNLFPEQVNGHHGDVGWRPEALTLRQHGKMARVLSQAFLGNHYLLNVELEGLALQVASHEAFEVGAEILIDLDGSQLMYF